MPAEDGTWEAQISTKTGLIIVACHGVCKKNCTGPDQAILDSSWYANFPGEGPLYVEHARAGVSLAAGDPGAILALSGGQTREGAGRRSEAESYWEIARAAGWWGHPGVEKRALKEEYARDSLENLLFPIALFKRETGRWPSSVAVVGWRFKEQRFGLHRLALKWPKRRFTYVGVNNPAGDGLKMALSGEKRKLAAARRDPLLLGAEWAAQREIRDPFRRGHPYRSADPGLARLFDFLDGHAPTREFPWTQ